MIVSRAEWGAKPPKSTPVRMAAMPSVLVYVHHTAGSERGAAGMRSIQSGHQRPKSQGGRGFNDVAYSFVIDGDDGVIYEGRGAGIRGGHVLGDENEHHGICLMGNYEHEPLTDAARRSLVDLLRHGHQRGWWQLNVRGHRQSPTASTACPGARLFAALPSIRQAAASPTSTPAPAPAPPVPIVAPIREDPAMWFAKNKTNGAVLMLLPTNDPDRPLVTMGVDGGSWGPPEDAQVWAVSDAKFDFLNGLRFDIPPATEG